MKSGSDLHSGRLSRCEADAALDTLPWRQRARLSGVAGRAGMAAGRRAVLVRVVSGRKKGTPRSSRNSEIVQL
eukprot:scaffold71962_cov30-Phaeocystis_antarctica.AAC.1